MSVQWANCGRPFTSKPKTEEAWLDYIFKHEGGYRDFRARFQQALLHVEVNQSRRFLLACSLLDVIADHRNLYRAFKKQKAKGSRPGPDGITCEQLENGLNVTLKRLSSRIKACRFPRNRECVIEKRKQNGGIRYTILQSIVDRIIDRAAAQILSEVFDPSFSPHSYAFRTGRGPWHAIRKATSLICQGYNHFVSCDIRNAFGSVPINRLLQLVESRLPDDRLQAFVSQRLSGCEVKGLRQGSPLSPVMLNLYLDHFLDGPWENRYPNTLLIRYVDDLLIACRSSRTAVNRYNCLTKRLTPTGMIIQESRQEAVFDTQTDPVPYLGFLISSKNGKAVVKIDTTKGINRLKRKLERIHRVGGDFDQCVGQWLTYFGPAYKNENRTRIFEKIRSIFSALGQRTAMPKREELEVIWENAYLGYLQTTRKALA